MKNIDPEKLLKLVEERPELWDKNLETYKDKYATRVAWREICVALNDGFQQLEEREKIAFDKALVAKWNHLRDNWVRHYKKTKFEQSNRIKTNKKYIYSEQMNFLKKIYDDPEVTSTIEPSLSEGSTSKPKRPNSVSSSSAEPSEKKNKIDDLEQKLLQILEKSTIASETANPHMAFFSSLMPSLSEMTEEQVLEFRMDVLMSVRRIRQSARLEEPCMKFESEDFCG